MLYFIPAVTGTFTEYPLTEAPLVAFSLLLATSRNVSIVSPVYIAKLGAFVDAGELNMGRLTFPNMLMFAMPEALGVNSNQIDFAI